MELTMQQIFKELDAMEFVQSCMDELDLIIIGLRTKRKAQATLAGTLEVMKAIGKLEDLRSYLRKQLFYLQDMMEQYV